MTRQGNGKRLWGPDEKGLTRGCGASDPSPVGASLLLRRAEGAQPRPSEGPWGWEGAGGGSHLIRGSFSGAAASPPQQPQQERSQARSPIGAAASRAGRGGTRPTPRTRPRHAPQCRRGGSGTESGTAPPALPRLPQPLPWWLWAGALTARPPYPAFRILPHSPALCCIHLHPPATLCTLLNTPATFCTLLFPPASTCTNPQPPAPSCIVLYHPSPSCFLLHAPAQTRIPLHSHASSCTLLYPPALCCRAHTLTHSPSTPCSLLHPAAPSCALPHLPFTHLHLPTTSYIPCILPCPPAPPSILPHLPAPSHTLLDARLAGVCYIRSLWASRPGQNGPPHWLSHHGQKSPLQSSAQLSFQACCRLDLWTQGCDPGKCNGKWAGGDGLCHLPVQGFLKAGEKSLKDCSFPLYFSLFYNQCSYHVPTSDPKEEDKV